ncbi:HAD-IIA family hydrolase [Prescottella subtropica]|uniref:HAD-IIA family hydrolase n=1 Tax=Prescottella subtropica TaxID=2545757 RepID=UPI001F501B94|nr:HAD-IIA family hydrolase [Prescottella subtropica]
MTDAHDAAGTTLRGEYDVLLLDLDGTVYQGPHAIPGAREALAAGDGRQFYVTNNASRTPGDVAQHLRDLGFDAVDEDVVTSSQSAARLLAERLDPGAAVLVVGTEALAGEITKVGLTPVRRFQDTPVAVVQGHNPDTGWRILAEATLAIRSGAVWVASNIDTTLPTERGLVLGNGSMVAALQTATGQQPLVAGKPAAPLMEDALRRSGADRPLVVGDRLDTDIAGANAVGVDSLLVLTGVSTPADLLRADASHRPTYVARSLDALNGPSTAARVAPHDGWRVEFESGDLVVHADGAQSSDRSGAFLSVLAAAWRHPEFVTVRAGDDTARAATAVLSGDI